jgi:hypothetical protein
MNWETQDKPGYTLLHAHTNNRLYAIQSKNGMGVWRLFLSENEQPNRAIFVGSGLAECQGYAEAYEGRAR